MVEIVVFGKPSTFESYKFDFGIHKVQNPENSHREPSIKPIDFNEPVIHFYRKDGIAGWEVYRRCKSFDSERPGIIFGVGIESDKDFGLMESLRNLLMPLWEDFAQAFIDENNKFKTGSITDALRTTKWSSEEERKICGYFKDNDLIITNEATKPLLLAVADFEDLNKIEESIKGYSDVYIASDIGLFKNVINKDVLSKQANNEIHIVKDGKIVVFKPSGNDNQQGGSKPSDGNGKRGRIWVWGKPRSGDNTSDSGSNGNPKPPTNLPTKLIAAIIVVLLIIAAFLVLKPKPADRIELAKAIGSDYITEGYDLHPTLFHGKSKRTSTDLKDITWKIEGEGCKYIKIDDSKIGIEPLYKTEKPRKDQSVTIIAYFGEKELGRETYTLGKYILPKANEVVMAHYSNSIKESFKINPQLLFNGDQNVSTKIDELKFEVIPEEYAKIDDEYKLVVTNRPETTDKQVTVNAYLDNQQIGQQTYTIAKKEATTSPSPPSNNVNGKILCKKKTEADSNYRTLSTFTTREIMNYNFIARDKDGKKLNGLWKCNGYDFPSEKQGQNPVNFKESPGPGNYTLEYWVGNQIRATIEITITE